MTFKVLVYDNFHYMDESERYEHGAYPTAEAALAAAKKIVDDFLLHEYKPGMKAAKLYEQYTSFGDDPFITSTDGKRVEFSAWRYAERRCGEICGEPFRPLRKLP